MVAYATLPVLGILVLGIGTVSAHGFFGGFGDRAPEDVAVRQTAMFEAKAQLLGVSVDAVKGAWATRKTMREHAEELGISSEELHERMRNLKQVRMREYLNVLVSQSVITQAQADQRVAALESRITNSTGFGDRFFRRSAHGGW